MASGSDGNTRLTRKVNSQGQLTMFTHSFYSQSIPMQDDTNIGSFKDKNKVVKLRMKTNIPKKETDIGVKQHPR